MFEYIMYGIYCEDRQEWFSVERRIWLEGFDGTCLFPSCTMAEKYLKEELYAPAAQVYRVRIPVKQGVYEPIS